jgi:cation transport regulator ChaB
MKKIIADIPKNTREVLRVELDEFSGRQLISARTWYRDGDDLKPTAKGLSIDIKHLSALREAIAEAEAQAKAAGLLPS